MMRGFTHALYSAVLPVTLGYPTVSRRCAYIQTLLFVACIHGEKLYLAGLMFYLYLLSVYLRKYAASLPLPVLTA
jgi:hypothetical protein